MVNKYFKSSCFSMVSIFTVLGSSCGEKREKAPTNSNNSSTTTSGQQNSSEASLVATLKPNDDDAVFPSTTELRPIWKQNIQYPMLMTFGAFGGIELPVNPGAAPLEPTKPIRANYATPEQFQAAIAQYSNVDIPAYKSSLKIYNQAKTAYDIALPIYTNILDAHLPYVWMHGGGLSPATVQLANDIVTKKIAPDKDGYDYWKQKKLPSKVLTIQMAYGGMGIDMLPYIHPSHVLYEDNVKVTNLSKQNTDGTFTVTVDNYKKLSPLLKHLTQGVPGTKPIADVSAALMYFVDENGKPEWRSAEWVELFPGDGVSTFIINRKIARNGAWTYPYSEVPNNSKAINDTTIKNGHVKIAPPIRFWDKQLQLNISLVSPKIPVGYSATVDSNNYLFPKDNESAQDFYARIVTQTIANSGAQGVEFDVGRWMWGRQNSIQMDVNNDGNVDHGWVNGLNVFGLGARPFFKKLRSLVGDTKIIQVDSVNTVVGTRDWMYVNGSQQESFPSANDFDRFSQAFLQLRTWFENEGKYTKDDGTAVRIPSLSYPFAKTVTAKYNLCSNRHINNQPTPLAIPSLIPNKALEGTEQYKNCFKSDPETGIFILNNNQYIYKYEGYNKRFRTTLASAVITSMPSPFMGVSTDKFDPYESSVNTESTEMRGVFNWEEFVGGDLNKPGWLGSPTTFRERDIADMSYITLVKNSKWTWQYDAGFSAENVVTGTTSADTFSAKVTTLATPSSTVFGNTLYRGVRLGPDAVNAGIELTPGKDYTLQFDASGDTTWQYNGADSSYTLPINGLPRLLTIAVPMKTRRTDEPLGVLITDTPNTYKISFVAADCRNKSEDHYGCEAYVNKKGDFISVPTNLGIFFGISEQVGTTKITNIRLSEGSAERWSRDFEGGKVILNMANKPWVFTAINPPINCHYARLKDRNPIPLVDDNTNDGSAAIGSITIPPQDALFLKKVCP